MGSVKHHHEGLSGFYKWKSEWKPEDDWKDTNPWQHPFPVERNGSVADLKQNELELKKAVLQQHEKEKGKTFGSYGGWALQRKGSNISGGIFKAKRQPAAVWEENRHSPGCWFDRDVSRCSVLSKGKSTMCTGRCDDLAHVLEKQSDVVKKRRVKKTKIWKGNARQSEDFPPFTEQWLRKIYCCAIDRLENVIKADRQNLLIFK